jgi:hypothetical protein
MLNCSQIGCGCEEPPYLPLMGLVASYETETCSNTCQFTDNEEDPCGYYLGATIEDAGINTGRIREVTYTPTPNECGNDCGEGEQTCSGSYEFKTGTQIDYTYPCGSATEEFGFEGSVTWNEDCTSNFTQEAALFQCSGSISVGTITGTAMEIDGECVFELIDSEGGDPSYAYPQNIGFGNEDFGGACAGQETVETDTSTRTPPEAEEEVITSWNEKNEDCEGWCGPGLEEIVDLSSHGEWDAAPQSVTIFGGSSIYGNVKSQETVQLKFAHTPSPTCYLQVWFRKKTTTYAPDTDECGPFFTGSPTESVEDDTYTWNGTDQGQNLCADLPLTESNITPDQVFYETTRTITAEAADGESVEVEFKILKWSFVPGYEPNDPDEGDQGCKPNGFPLCGNA